MPRLGSESNSSVRRHNPTQTLSNYFQVTSQVWQIRSSGVPRPDLQTYADSSTTQTQATAEAELDVLDDLLNRTRASGSRTRWNARPFGSPYGHRPLHKWLPSEQKHFEEMSALMEMFPEPGSDDESEGEKDLHEIVAEEKDLDQLEEDDDEADEEFDEDEEDGSEPEEADIGRDAQSQTPLQPQSASAAKRREKNKKKRARARAKAKDKDKMKPPPSPDPVRDPPQDLLVSMSRIAQLVGSLNTDSPDESNQLLQRVRDAFTEEGRRQLGSHQPSEPAQWRAEVLQSVRRMESMLGQMEKWQAQVAPGEIEALRAETARLEVRVRAVVEQKERERAEVRAASSATQTRDLRATAGSSKAKDEVEAEVAEAEEVESSDDEGPVQLDGDGLFQAGAKERHGVDPDSVSDSFAESISCPSEGERRQTEPEPDDRFSKEDKSNQPYPTLPDHTSPPTCIDEPALAVLDPPPLTIVIQPAYNHAVEIVSAPTTPSSPLSSVRPSDAPAVATETAQPPSPSSLAGKNQNVPPEPPADPVDYLTNYPWTMTEVLFLLEIVAHFPPAEQGWTFVAEAYNNILITRPLQEWFGKQATASNDEEMKMKSTLQKMNAEARQLRTRRAQEVAAQGTAVAATVGVEHMGERGKAAPFGSTAARAEANARAKHAATAGALDEDTLILTRLPFPFPAPDGTTSAADNPATPPPAQRIIPFPRRRPPLNLPSEDAKAFARVMESAVAGVRPPSTESRAAMLALYSATKARFPVRTPWDCWHRWCTPWVVQEADASAEWELPPIVLDYIAGNICLPVGTWITQAPGFVYRPVPGTYPDVPGVQRKVTEYDPRPGMVAFARMSHLLAERNWSGIGLRRKLDGTVSGEVLAGRRAKLPGTLAGIWPGRSAPAKSRPAPQPAATQPLAAELAPAPLVSGPSSPETKKARIGPLPANPSKGAPAVPAPAASSTSSTSSTSAPVATAAPPNTTTNPRSPFLPIPLPRPQPPVEPPHVPEGTLGHPTRPGMTTWFERATFRVDVLERSLAIARLRAQLDEAVTRGMSEHRGVYPAESDSVDPGNSGGAWREGGGVMKEEEDEEQGRRVPLHLRKLVVPPPPPLHVRMEGRMGAQLVSS
ncbi:hypothetical protein BC628DRAFT_1525445 [Trametes gibbosa]|nr:hypothetical protein BC628DRAFT_1525445 [Trametes gibbosa]